MNLPPIQPFRGQLILPRSATLCVESHEHAFLTSLTRALCPGGVLVYLVPQARLSVSARYLASHYAGLRAWRFPDPEYTAFRQVVLLATRKPKAIPNPAAQADVEAWGRGGLSMLPDAEDDSA